MIDLRDVQTVARLPGEKVLSVYLTVDPAVPENQHAPPAYRSWLKHALDALEPDGDHQNRMAYRDLVQRVHTSLDDYRPAGKGLAIFATDGQCQLFDLLAPVPNEARFGRPYVAPLRWQLAQFDHYGVVYVDHRELRLLNVSQGRATTWGGACLVLDTAQWTHSDLMPAASSGPQVLAGSDRSAFEHRVAEQQRRFWRESVDRIQAWVAGAQLARLVIGGNTEAVTELTASMPPALAGLVVGTLALPGYETDAKLLERVAPVAAADAQARASAVVQRLRDEALAGGRGALGLAKVLSDLGKGRVMTLVAAWPVTGEAWVCPVCGLAQARTADDCPNCAAAMVRRNLSDLLPQLAERTDAELELVDGEAAEALADHEGIGALLRY